MRPNPVKQRLLAGGHAFGTMVFEFFTSGISALMDAAGAEFAIFDTEHGGAGIETLRRQMAFARGTACVPIVRVPGTDYTPIAAALDAGALGIMAPMVESAGQAAHLVACTRYPPAGRRGAAFGIAHDDYGRGPVAETMAAADARTLLIAMVETVPGVAAVDAIAATPGVDVVWLGHFDLTLGMGIPGQFAHPDYLAAVARIRAAAARHGKAAGMMAADAAWAERHLAQGFRMIAYGIDHLIFRDALAEGLARVRALPR